LLPKPIPHEHSEHQMQDQSNESMSSFVAVGSNQEEKQDDMQNEQDGDMAALVKEILAKLNEEGREEVQGDSLADISVKLESDGSPHESDVKQEQKSDSEGYITFQKKDEYGWEQDPDMSWDDPIDQLPPHLEAQLFDYSLKPPKIVQVKDSDRPGQGLLHAGCARQ
jgi:hypothetical protein